MSFHAPHVAVLPSARSLNLALAVDYCGRVAVKVPPYLAQRPQLQRCKTPRKPDEEFRIRINAWQTGEILAIPAWLISPDEKNAVPE